MRAAECVLSFLIWVAFGVSLRHRVAPPNSRRTDEARGSAAFRGAAMLVYSAVWLLASLFVVQAFGGLTPTGFKLWAWLLVTLAGLEFVRAQMVAVATMVGLVNCGNTPREPESSKMQDTEEREP